MLPTKTIARIKSPYEKHLKPHLYIVSWFYGYFSKSFTNKAKMSLYVRNKQLQDYTIEVYDLDTKLSNSKVDFYNKY